MKTVRRASIYLASIVACVFFGALEAPAKPVSYLPANALNATAVESDQPNIRVFEQRGLLPTRGSPATTKERCGGPSTGKRALKFTKTSISRYISDSCSSRANTRNT